MTVRATSLDSSAPGPRTVLMGLLAAGRRVPLPLLQPPLIASLLYVLLEGWRWLSVRVVASTGACYVQSSGIRVTAD
jgi:hypothetical protein